MSGKGRSTRKELTMKATATVLWEDVATEERLNGRSVFSNAREIITPAFELAPPLFANKRLKMDGLDLLALLPADSIPVAFLDPQYRGVLDRLAYGNEGVTRGRRRAALQQMTEGTIAKFVIGINRVLSPSGHLFLWMDKFHLCQGFTDWLDETRLDVVDMVVWDKERMGMGYRTRRQSEFCVVLQKQPRRAKGVWKTHNIRDVNWEKVDTSAHPHAKPVKLQMELIKAVSNIGDYVVDPAAGSFSVMESANQAERNFIGCDIVG